MRSIREESQSSEESGKENAASKANIIVSQSVPNQSTFYNSTVSLSQQSQVPYRIYSQTCLKGSPKGRTKRGCLRQVTP